MNHWKKNIETRVEQFQQFYKRENKNALLGFFHGSEYPIHRYPTGKTIPERIQLTPEHFPVEPYLDDFDHLFDIHEACGGDFIWSASIFWGVPWVEATLGCPIQLSDYRSGSIHAEPIPGFSGADDVPVFSKDNPWVIKALEFLEKSSARSQGRWPIATTRMRGISDLLSLLYGGEELVFEMMEKPEKVQATAQKLTDFWIEFGKMQIEKIPLFHGGIGSFYYNCWAPEGTIWHQEDAMALLSPQLFEEFIKPCGEKIVAAFNGCIMHEHSTGYIPWKHYKEMNFTALEMHIDSGGPSAESLFDTHQQIMARKPLIIWGDIPEKDLDWIFEKLPHQGLAIITCVDSPEQAEIIWKRYF